MIREPHRRAGAAIALAAGAAGLAGCESYAPPPVTVEPVNLPPRVLVISGIEDGGIVSATEALIHVDGDDDDGEVVGFRYAIEPGDDSDWVDFVEGPIRPRFTATSPQYGGVAVSDHTMTLLAIDDRGALSDPLTLRFVARTFTPTITLVSRDPAGDDQVAEYDPGEAIGFDWRGYDADPGHVPLRTQWKLILLPDDPISAEEVLTELRGQPSHPRNLLIPDPLAVPWGEALPSDAHVRATDWWPPREAALEVERFEVPKELVSPGRTYAVAVRAVDAALAVTAHADLTVREDGQPGNVIRVRRRP